MSDNVIVFSLRLPTELSARIDDEAIREDRSRAKMIVHLLKRALDDRDAARAKV